MISETIKRDIDKLVLHTQQQENRINLSTIIITLKCDVQDVQEIIDYIESNGIEVINEDVEPESESTTEIDNAISPFDPSKIDIKMANINIDSIIKRIRNKELEFDSSFQRKAGLWNIKQKSQLIESIFLKIPLPAFYFDASDDDKWQIIDGLQRISTIRDYVVWENFSLDGMEFLKDLNGLKYSQLPRSLQRRLEETQLNTYQVNPSTPKNVKFNIFKRINTGGLTLESQEIRNALYQGQATEFLEKMSKTKEFKEATGYSIKTDRMLDREFCLRYVAFAEKDLSEYMGNLENYLNDTMDYLNGLDNPRLEKIEGNFKRAMRDCYKIFGEYAFRRVNTETKRRGPVNKALFEGWSVIVNSLNNSQVSSLVDNKETIKNNFFLLLDDYQFQNAIKASDKTSVNTRISEIRKIVNSIL